MWHFFALTTHKRSEISVRNAGGQMESLNFVFLFAMEFLDKLDHVLSCAFTYPLRAMFEVLTPANVISDSLFSLKHSHVSALRKFGSKLIRITFMLEDVRTDIFVIYCWHLWVKSLHPLECHLL